MGEHERKRQKEALYSRGSVDTANCQEEQSLSAVFSWIRRPPELIQGIFPASVCLLVVDVGRGLEKLLEAEKG